MIEIIATAAVSALASSAVIHQVYSDKVRRLRNSNACRDRKLSEAATLEKQLRGWLGERDAQISDLKGARDVWRDEADKYREDCRAKARLLKDAIVERDEARRQLTAEKARDSARTAKGNRTRKLNRLAREAEAAGGWIEWAGGECPLPEGTPHQVKLRDGDVSDTDTHPHAWRWSNEGHPSDIIAYRMREAA